MNLDEEPCFFDEFDTTALQKQLDLQTLVAAYAKKAKHAEIPQALSNRLERRAIVEEIAGRYTQEQIEEMLQHVAQRPYGFLFVDLKTTDPNKMFQDSLVQYLRPTE